MADGLDLGKQIGPLPLGAWLVVVGTGVGVAVWARGPGSGTAEDAAPVVDEWSSTGTGVTGQWVDVTPPPPQGPDPVTDNDEWGRQAVQWLIAEGYDPAMSQSAIAKALQERRLSVREYALWWAALRKFGPPPYAVVVTQPGNPAAEPSKPARDPGFNGPRSRAKWYVTRGGESLRLISRRAYGTENKWDNIYHANKDGTRRPDGSRGWVNSPNQKMPPLRRLYIPRG